MLFVIALTLGIPITAHATESGPCAGHWQTQHQVKQGIRCVFARWETEGGIRKALDVARCESGFRPDAVGGDNWGLFQHRASLWDSRFTRYIERNTRRSSWGLSPSAFSGRTNAIVTALYVRAHSWSAWSCG